MKDAIQNYFAGNHLTFYEKYLGQVKHIGGDEYQALCPFHDDKEPSLNFNNEKGLYFCHGCGKKGHLFHFYAKLNGLDTRADFPKILKGIASDFGIQYQERKSKIVKTYDYVDEAGNSLFQVCRMDPKDFRQRHKNGNGWAWNLKGVRRVLYRLPQIINAQEVLVVEGEKVAETLANLGLTGTTCPMGAGKWLPEYSETLKDKSVVLIPDNDTKGREHMAKVADSLRGAAKSLKWIDLPGLPSKGDLSDWAAKFDDPTEAGERLAVMISQAGPYKPPKIATIEDVVLELNDFRKMKLPEKRALLVPWLSEQSIILLTGWRGTGKTWFAMSLMDAISKGEGFGPWPIGVSVPCLYLEGEMAAQDVRERLEALNQEADRENPLFVYSDAYANSLGLPRANLLSEKWRSTMKRILTTRKIKLWAVDNLASLTGGIDENSKKDWDPINTWLLELRFAGISTILLHHTNKTGGQRGTSAREDNIDISITLKRPPNYVSEEGAKFIVSFEKARVRSSDLKLIADTEFHLTQDERTGLTWTYGEVKKQTRIEVLKLLDEGLTNNAVAEILGITRGRVSQLRKSGLDSGFIGKNGKLTQAGFTHVYGAE